MIATGTIIAHRYEILERISEGGMATVFRGRRLPDGETIALKILRDQYATDREFIERFQREAKAVSELTHPHMVQVYDSGNDGSVYYIAMEYVDGENLKELLRARGRFEPEQAVSIVAQVCEALEFAHSHGIVHRDIKPQNILLTPDGQVKVTDFGIARASSAATITQTGTVLGSVQYLAPEQARGAIVGRAADIYALGVVLYELVTGKLPFEGDSPVAIAIKHIHQTPPRPRALVPLLPARLEAIIVRAMAKSPYDRYRSAGELRGDLLGETDLWKTKPAVVPPLDEPPTLVLKPERSRPPGLRRLTQEQQVSPSVMAALLLVVFFGVIVGGWRAVVRYLAVPEVTVPNIVGKPLADAERIARPLRLPLQVTEVFSSTVPAGTVVSQDQASGRLVKVGRILGIEVSIGPETVIVPDVQRRSLMEAELLIDQARLRTGELREAYEEHLQSGFILSQDPQPGAKVPRDRTVNLVVSKGPQRIELPQLVGRSLQDVRRLLQDLGITLQEVRMLATADQPPGVVVDQTPAAGTKIRPQDPVVVTVSTRPGEESKPPPTAVVTAEPKPSVQSHTKLTRVRLVVPEGEAEQSVKIVVIDELGTRTVYERKLTPGTRLDEVIRTQGYTIIQVYVQNHLVQEIRP